ncbi:hypothetical protein ACG7TL_005424 [Trametes sanguinea]
MLQSPSFINRVLRKPSFARRVLSIVVDEAHCVSHWGADFRKKYSSLGIVRAFLPRGTPIVAVTATLTARVRRDLHRTLHFSSGSRFLNVGNDHPNVAIVVRAFEHAQNTFNDIDFLIPAASELLAPCDIPKTYLYVDNINTGNELVDHLSALIAERQPDLATLGLVWAAVFEMTTISNAIESVHTSCCDVCDPRLFNRTRPGQNTVTRRAKLRAKGKPDFDAQDRLDEWRHTVFQRDHASSQLDPSAILDDASLTMLTSVGPLSATAISSMLSNSWIWWNQYGEELSLLLASLYIRYQPLKKHYVESDEPQEPERERSTRQRKSKPRSRKAQPEWKDDGDSDEEEFKEKVQMQPRKVSWVAKGKEETRAKKEIKGEEKEFDELVEQMKKLALSDPQYGLSFLKACSMKPMAADCLPHPQVNQSVPNHFEPLANWANDKWML